MKKCLILIIALITFNSGFSATFDVEDVGDKIEMVVADVGDIQAVITLEVGNVTFETSISTDLNIDENVYSTEFVTVQKEALTTLTPLDDVGWEVNLIENKEPTYVEANFMRSDHQRLCSTSNNYKDATIVKNKERFMFNSFSCN